MGTCACLSRRLAGFRSVGIAFILFSLLNLALSLLISLYPQLLEGLWLSADRPWGVVTSAFVHADIGHLVNNLEMFTIAAGLFVVVSVINPVGTRRRWSRAFLWLAFLSGIGANLFEYPLALVNPGDVSWGASGIVYGGLGVLLAASLRSLPTHLRAIAEEHRRWAGKRRVWRLFKFDRKSLRTLPDLLCIAVLISFLVPIFTNTGMFLSVRPGVDVLAHGLGFLFGFLPAMLLFTPRFQARSKTREIR